MDCDGLRSALVLLQYFVRLANIFPPAKEHSVISMVPLQIFFVS